tara:strand:- start:6400 stop:8913 length:2514 start_codon:yes stop_codon:yes gene_type:complete
MPRLFQAIALPNRLLIGALSAVLLISAPLTAAPIIQPGPPGEASRALSADEAVAITDTSYSADDVYFMQAMIPHHEQALEMSILAETRTNMPELLDIAGKIKASQSDEVAFMQGWLNERDESAEMAMSHDGMDHSAMGHSMADDSMDHAAMGHHMYHDMDRKKAASNPHEGMMGMASPEQMADLAASEATAFDTLFLELMIAHHEGAIDMVDDLLDQPGSAHDPVLYEFVGDIKNDQRVEIERMHALLVTLFEDPRANLAPGLYDAGVAIKNMKLVSSLKKPAGFVNPENPAELPKRKEEEPSEDGEEPKKTPVEGGPRTRSPLLSFSNTDMAFADDTLVAGSYHGFNIYDIANQGDPELISSVVCPGGQGDVSIVGDLLIMSVEQTRGRLDCGLQGVAEDVSDERFRGIRIFDISDLGAPKQVGAVQTCRGSHTHSVVSGPDEDGKIIVYNSGTSSIRDREEMESCFDDTPGDSRTALFRIDVIEIPVDNPAASRIIDSPAVFADEETGALAGLWRGGDHGGDTQDTRPTDECHDITVFPSLNIAAGACSGNGILFDISDPMKPTRIDVVSDDGFAYWHSATFNNDGTKVLFTDEWGGGSRPRCRAFDPMDWGADAIYDIVDGKLEFKSYFKIPAPQLEQENCVAHNGSIVPVPGRDIFVQAWYQGGLSVIDFTDSANPIEIAYFDRGPIDAEELITGGFWSTYWYDGLIYGTEITRGLDVLELLESDHLSANEIAATNLADQGAIFNPQQQLPVSWPMNPKVALAYLDQLARSGDAMGDHEELRSALEAADRAVAEGETDRKIRRKLRSLSRQIKEDTGLKKDLKMQLERIAETI